MKWKLVPVEPTPEMVDAAWDSKGADYVYIHSASDAYSAMLEAAPMPPALTDKRIMEVARSQSCPNTGGFWFEGKSELIDMVRAIEREILGGDK